MQATAVVAVAALPARSVKTADVNSEATIGIFRLAMGEKPRRRKASQIRPPTTLPATPNRKGMDATQPVRAMLR